MDYPQDPRRRAEFIFPTATLKNKVGSGGLDDSIIQKAQRVIEETTDDFVPMGQRYLNALQEGINMTIKERGKLDDEFLLSSILYPAMQLKANGAMFGFPLVTSISARLIRFLEQLKGPDAHALQVVTGFVQSLQAVLLMGEKDKHISAHADEIYEALDQACLRYFEKHGY
jgi:hypothetical protein